MVTYGITRTYLHQLSNRKDINLQLVLNQGRHSNMSKLTKRANRCGRTAGRIGPNFRKLWF